MDNLKNIGKVNKALVPVAITAILGVLSAFGISENITLGEMVTAVVTTVAVYFVPNR